ncbi:MAG: hypothetical protein AAF950_12840 [Pseudomonadota bacterium]
MTDYWKSDISQETSVGSRPEAKPRIGLGSGVRVLFRQVLALIGLFLVVISVPLGFLTPFLPIGLPIGILGAALLARNSVWGQQLIRHLLNKYPKLDKFTPEWLLKLITGSGHSSGHTPS